MKDHKLSEYEYDGKVVKVKTKKTEKVDLGGEE
jgi:hypothetical protein